MDFFKKNAGSKIEVRNQHSQKHLKEMYLEFITRIQVNGVKEEVSGAKASEIIRERVENALQAMNYEKRAAG